VYVIIINNISVSDILIHIKMIMYKFFDTYCRSINKNIIIFTTKLIFLINLFSKIIRLLNFV